MTQTEVVLNHLKTVGSISPREALMDHGVSRLAARIHELRLRGWEINGEFQSNPSTGLRYMRYTLH